MAAQQLEVGAAGTQAVAEQLIGLAEPQERGCSAQRGGGGSPLRHPVRYLFAQDRDLRRRVDAQANLARFEGHDLD